MLLLTKLFGFNPSQSTIRKEIIAGITTFLTMSYILAVNPSMFGLLEGMPIGSVFTATALASIIGCLAMALIGKLPFGLAPGMGLNAFFVYSVCLGMGYSWQFALTAVFIEGIIFIILTLTNVREAIVNAIPMSLRNAIGAGIGLFIAFIGLESAVALKNGYALAIAMTIGLVNRDLGADAGLHYNSQAGAFYQAVKEMRYLLEMQGASRDCENIGIGDLYVTVYGGRTRKIGILLGEGKTYDEALEILSGVTLESLVVARRVYAAMVRKAELGQVDLNMFPMLCHAAAVLDEGKDAHLPWDAFTFDQTK